MANTHDILFGSDPTERIVAVEIAPSGAVIFRRDGNNVSREERPFAPWLLTTERLDLPGADWLQLEGEGYAWMARFANWQAHQQVRYRLRDEHISHVAFGGAEKQYLMTSGQTLFMGMSFDDVHRLQLDIETLGFSPKPRENAVFLVAISDNRGNELLISGPEEQILREVIRTVRDLDPDFIEGHNIYGFDLPYLAGRAELHGIDLTLGRDGSRIRFGSERAFAAGGASRPYTPVYIHGRHVVDTLLSVQRYDVPRGVLTSHGLKECAKAFGVAPDDRVYIPHDKIAQVWKDDPDCVKTYTLQDVQETRAVAEIVCPPDFYTAQMVPDTYQNGLTSGTGEKINSILIREYLRQGKAIPKPRPPKSVSGGYTDVRKTGIIDHVVKCDVESLYPSIMLTYGVKPASDTLDVFLPALSELTNRRFEAKARARASGGKESAYWDGLQASFKILINSFYGYLGAVFHFNDYDAADKVTTSGRDIVLRIVDELTRTGSEVIEIDTDGVYFTPAPGIDTEEAEMAYVDSIGSCLPQGIRLAHDGRYELMISLKVKNYVLVDYQGRKVFKGASVRSRADERFGRAFITEAVDLLVQNKPDAVAELYTEMSRRIGSREMPVHDFCRRERVTEKTFTSSAKKRSAEVAKGARVGDHINVYQKEDGSLGLAEDYANDEDQSYLLDKLYKFACRLREAFGDDFDRLFPKPSGLARAEAAGQQKLSLFD
ncbi:MAG: DNA polymerase domain-containing protein [Armatimonadota bacterium]|nr:DNA polymerase domain-containing protein [Armatimonadota bacterium]